MTSLPVSSQVIDFSRAVPAGGYAWWYIDALADDGERGLTVIAFVGSVFSPRYARARRRGPASADAHCALNVVLYGGDQQRWVFTEYAPSHVRRSATHFTLAANNLSWDGQQLQLSVDDRSAPLGRRVRGTITVTPQPLVDQQFMLDGAGAHRWRPLAPYARVSVRMDAPSLSWQGQAYVDCNHGDAPLARDFQRWDWCRGHGAQGTHLLYDVHGRDGAQRSLNLHFDMAGVCRSSSPPRRTPLPTSRLWRIQRRTQSESGHARVIKTLEDTPFYARSLVETALGGAPLLTVHESLSVDRFEQPWVQALLPFRMRYIGV